MDRKSSEKLSREQARRLGALAATGLVEGTLALRHVVGLDDKEMDAIAHAADQLRQLGRVREAAQVYGLLVTQDPLQARYWRALADLQQELGNHPLALACYELLALLEDRTAEATRREARSLSALDEGALAAQMQAVADQLARSTSDLSTRRRTWA